MLSEAQSRESNSQTAKLVDLTHLTDAQNNLLNLQAAKIDDICISARLQNVVATSSADKLNDLVRSAADNTSALKEQDSKLEEVLDAMKRLELTSRHDSRDSLYDIITLYLGFTNLYTDHQCQTRINYG
jgi:hypothetical protein